MRLRDRRGGTGPSGTPVPAATWDTSPDARGTHRPPQRRAHLGLDAFEIVVTERRTPGKFEVVVEAVLDRRAEGQSKAWSPWSWNPIQGGGVGSWARVTEFKHLTGQEHPKTSLVYEYPRAEGDPYYPVPRPENAVIYKHLPA